MFVYLLYSLFVLQLCSALYVDNTQNMASLDFATLPSEERALHVPPLPELADVLSRGLAGNFATAAAEVVDCPDLTQEPWGLSSPGLAGDAALVELGGPPYLLPLVQRDKLYDLVGLARWQRRDPACLLGAGAGPWPHINANCEGIINLSVRNGTVTQGTRIVSVTPAAAGAGAGAGAAGPGYLQQTLPPSETRTALLGNYLLSDGAPGKVVRVTAETRTGDANFVTAVREALTRHYGDRVVGLGGAFLLRAGRERAHVMPDFSAAPIETEAGVERWLRYFELRAPVVHVGTLVTGDLGLDLRAQHFHGFSAHGDGGHYHGDTTPRQARYEALLLPARRVLRVDRPPATHQLGRD